jgi:hypothetical protein
LEIDTRNPSCVEKLHEEQMTIALCECARCSKRE